MEQHIQDQLSAAVRQVQRYKMSSLMSGAVNSFTDDKVLAFVTSVLDTLRVTDASCDHLENPQPVFVEVWHKPWTARCLRCSQKANAEFKKHPDFAVLDNTCDLCGRYDPTGVYPCQSIYGPFMLSFGLCDHCHTPQKKES